MKRVALAALSGIVIGTALGRVLPLLPAWVMIALWVLALLWMAAWLLVTKRQLDRMDQERRKIMQQLLERIERIE